MRRGRPGRVPSPPSGFAGFRYPPDLILVAVRWYLRYALSYRDVEELLAERGIVLDRARHGLPLGAAVYPAAHRRGTTLSARARRPVVHR
jgi:transposase-like protein